MASSQHARNKLVQRTTELSTLLYNLIGPDLNRGTLEFGPDVGDVKDIVLLSLEKVLYVMSYALNIPDKDVPVYTNDIERLMGLLRRVWSLFLVLKSPTFRS